MTGASQSNANKPLSSGIVSTAPIQGELEKFLSERGLEPEIAIHYGFSASNGRIEIQYQRDGVTIYKKFRGIKEKTFFCEEGNRPFFWNIDAIRDSSLEREPLIITEGEFDALAAIQCGFPRTVSVPNGAGGNSLAYLDEVEQAIREIPEIILATDSDEKGQQLQHDLAIRIGKARCKWVKYPKECKDLNDALRKYGKRGVTETINRASWLDVNGVYRMGDLPPIPYAVPMDIGIGGFENTLRIRLGDFSVWTGVPGSGKSTFVNDVMCRLAVSHGVKTAFASFEQPPQTEHKRNLRTWHSGILEKRMSDDQKEAADKWINNSFVFIVPSEDDMVTLEWALERAAVAVIRHGVKIVVIDPWNEMDHERPQGMSLTEYTGFAIKQFKSFAKKYRVHVAVVAHPAKMSRNKEGKYPVPTLYDISDSAHWYNKADLGVIVHRSDDGDFIQVAKSRYHNEIGKPGVVDVKFSMDTGRYMSVDNSVLYGR